MEEDGHHQLTSAQMCTLAHHHRYAHTHAYSAHTFLHYGFNHLCCLEKEFDCVVQVGSGFLGSGDPSASASKGHHTVALFIMILSGIKHVTIYITLERVHHPKWKYGPQ